MRIKYIFISFFLIFLIAGCSSKQPENKGQSYYVFGKKYTTTKNSKDFSQKGIASWYGKKFHGRKTANGETYNMYSMTCAHKTLPFDTKLKVENLNNGKTTFVRVNDRGPFVKRRIIDLSYTAAKKLGVDITGTAPVRIRSIDGFSIKDYKKGPFTIQVGAFTDIKNAKRLRSKLSKKYSPVFIKKFEKSGDIFYRVRAGKFNSLKSAEKNEELLRRSGYKSAFSIAFD